MRFLFVTVDGGGNLAPELSLAGRLVARGHEVRFLAQRCQEQAVRRSGCEFVPFTRGPEWDWTQPDEAPIRDWEVSPLKEFAQMRDRILFGPAEAIAADVLDELDREPADAVAVDFFLFGAQAAAEKAGVPSAVIWHTIYGRDDWPTPPFGSGTALAKGWPGRLRDRALRGMSGRLWNKGLPTLNEARSTLGLDPLDGIFEQFDRVDRVLVTTSPEFDFAAISGCPLPQNVRYVGPQVEVAPVTGSERAAPGEPPLVLASLSTSYQGQGEALGRIVEALGSLPVRGVVTTGPAVELDGPFPDNVEVHRWVPHAELLPQASLVLTHAGHGTAMTALAHGVPLVCMPMGRDQPDVAARVTHAGVGLRISPKARAAKIAATVEKALADRSLAESASRLRGILAAELEADRAVAELEALARGASEGVGSDRRMEAIREIA